MRDFRPAIKDGKSGLWDDVEKKMYYTPSGENFTVGGVVSTWTGKGTTAKWSEAANWDVAPTTGTGAKLVFQPGADTLTTENDIAGLTICNLAVIGTNGTFNLSGEKLSFYPFGGTAVSAVHSNLTLNISAQMDFKTDGSFKSRGNATFDGDCTFADGISFAFNPSWSGKDDYTTIFNGAFNASKATIDIRIGANDSRSGIVKFNQPVNVKEFVFGYSYLNNKIYFNASGNTIGRMNVTGHVVYFRAENPLTPGTIVNWFNCSGYPRHGTISFSKDGGNTVELDRIESTDSFITRDGFGQSMSTESSSKLTTLDLHGTADAMSYGYFAKGISLVWDPTGDFTQEFRDRIHQMNGTITVKGGTFKSGGTNAFPRVSKVIVCDGARFVAESTMPFSKSTVDLEIRGSGKLVLPEGTSCSFKSVTVDDLPIPGTNYVGVGCGGEGTVEAAWLEGSAVVAAPQINATFWNVAASGDWGTAANWSDGVPGADKPGYIAAKGGDYTVTVKADDAAPGTLTIINNGTGTATVKVEGTVAWPAVNCAIRQGGCLEVPSDATLDCNDSSATFTVDKGEFRVSGGTASFAGAEANNFTGAFSVTGDETHTGRVTVTAGVLRYGPQSIAASYKLKVKDFGRLDVSGTGALHSYDGSNASGALAVDGGEFNLNGTGVFSSGDDARVFCGMFGSGRTVFAGNSTAYFNVTTSDTKSKLYVTPGGAGETAWVEFRDQAQIDEKATGNLDGFVVGNTANATGVLVFASSARQPSANGVPISYRLYLGSYKNACGIMKVEKGYVHAAGYRGMLVGGSPRGKYGSVETNSHGELYVSGGCCRLDGRSTDSDEAYMPGMAVGDASNVIDTKNPAGTYADNARLADGYLELSGEGVVSNMSSITVIGGGRATGLFRQTDGTYEQCSSEVKSPFVVGNAGGFGTYLLNGGAANLNGDMFIGGTFTNHIASGGFMATYGYPVDCHTATGVVRVTGGALAVKKDLNLGWDGRGVLEIEGTDGSVTVGGDLVLSNTVVSADVATSSALKFTFDENGVSPIKVSGKVLNTEGTVIDVDLTKFTGQNGKVKLLTYEGFEGAEPEVRLTGPDADRMVVRRTAHALSVGFPTGLTFLIK